MQHHRFRSTFPQRLLLAATLAAGMATAAAQGGPAVERGRYLVTTILACGNCHTPKDAEGQIRRAHV